MLWISGVPTLCWNILSYWQTYCFSHYGVYLFLMIVIITAAIFQWLAAKYVSNYSFIYRTSTSVLSVLMFVRTYVSTYAWFVQYFYYSILWHAPCLFGHTDRHHIYYYVIKSRNDYSHSWITHRSSEIRIRSKDKTIVSKDEIINFLVLDLWRVDQHRKSFCYDAFTIITV